MKKIIVNCKKQVAEFPHFWESTGLEPAKLLLDTDMQQNLVYAGAVPHKGITHVRIHFLLDLISVKGMETELPQYDWTNFDKGIDLLVHNRLKPFFELMGNPSDFFNDFCDPAQVHQYKRLVRDTALHLIERYGFDEVKTWYFEGWNEPDCNAWWHQWPKNEQSYLNYFDACVAGLEEAHPDLIIGGPGTSSHISSLFKAFVAHCDSGKNFFSDKNGLEIDFISFHEKGGPGCFEDINPNMEKMVRGEIAFVEYIRKNHPRLAKIPVMNNECDPIVGWDRTHTYHGKPFYAAMIVRTLNDHLRQMIQKRKINYRLLSNDNGFVASWGNRTLMARLGRKDQIEKGEFALIKKPCLNAMTLLSLLGDTLVASTGNEKAFGDLGNMATIKGNGYAAILVYHSRDIIMSSGSEKVSLTITGLPFKKAMLAHYRIDENHGNPFAIWEKDFYWEKAWPAAELIEKLRNAQELTLLEKPVEINTRGGKVTRAFDLPLHAVSLLVLQTRPEAKPEKITGLRVEISRGLQKDFEDVLVSWMPSESYAIKTYEVLASDTESGAGVRINKPNLLDGVFAFSRKKGSRNWIQVRAMDYWGRKGEPSERVNL